MQLLIPPSDLHTAELPIYHGTHSVNKGTKTFLEQPLLTYLLPLLLIL